MKVGIVIQARLGSTRLPNKVIKPLYSNSTTVIKEIIERSQSVKGVSEVIVAISDTQANDQLEGYIRSNTSAGVFRGSEDNVLERYCTAAEEFGFDHIVRLTGDNPCIDPISISETIESQLISCADYSHTTGYPIGMNVEVVKTKALFEARAKGVSKNDTEHVTFYIKRNPESFMLNTIETNLPIDVSGLRITMDTPEDYTLIRIIFDFLKWKNKFFGIKEIMQLYSSSKYIFQLNSDTLQKKVYKNIKEELVDAYQLLQVQELKNAANLIKARIEG